MAIFWKTRPRMRHFEEWCEATEPSPKNPHFDFAQYLRTHEKLSPEKRGETFQHDVQSAVQQEKRIVVTTGGGSHHPFVIDLRDAFAPRDLRPDTKSHFRQLSISEVTEVKITSAVIRDLYVSRNVGRVEFNDCCVANLFMGQKTATNLVLRNCWIGKLELEVSAVKDLFLKGGSIRSIDCIPPYAANPFSGSVSIHRNVIFPTSLRRSRLLRGAEGYRNMRAHLEKLENAPAAILMRSLELATERREERGFTKLVSWVYGTFANYGLSPGRPLVWAVGLYLISVAVIFLFDGGDVGMEASNYFGWRTALTETGSWADLRRAAILSLQSIVNPFGLFGVRKLVVAATGWGQIWLSVQGFMTDVFLAMTIFGIRKRFKLH